MPVPSRGGEPRQTKYASLNNREIPLFNGDNPLKISGFLRIFVTNIKKI